ncbi:chromosomal replication initiator protein DnaA [Tepidamorphus gemmatus]|uniref:Chromosomal replication initiator protein DnaA n=1 Tax=Tepidamorphus gemmatus TaxID=747076 RepID=A0A4R3MEC1_9HYPH|nr:chromosomal replication initiator protein DnaA [Tepidamorphus gemmatus]TCT12010.1 chromosomal replication initiator protein DnaA [Tepidamorphus gemmatus]
MATGAAGVAMELSEDADASANWVSGGADRQAETAGAAVTDSGARHAEAWSRIVQRLRAEFGEDIYRSWFKGLSFVEVSDMTAVLTVATPFLRMWIRTNYGARLLALWRAECPGVERVDVRVRGVETATPERSTPAPVQRRLRDTRSAPALVQPATASGDQLFESAPLDPRFKFETFAVGESNKIAHDTALSVATSGSAGTMFNPLFIHGGVGRGKTHLLHAIAWKAAELDPSRRILHLSAEQFVFRFVSAVRSDAAIPFKETLRSIDLMLIDDLQFLQGKATHREFSHTMNALIEGCRQVVIVADRPPADLCGFDDRTRSRLAGGLVAAIGSQELALRRQILEARVRALAERGQSVDLSTEVLDYVARQVSSSGRDLEGALNRLAAYRCFANVPVTLDLAERVIRDLVATQERPQIRIEDIQRVVAMHYQVSRSDLVSNRRTRAIVVPRQIAMYLAKVLTPRSLPEIGRRFGNRDHTTVLHAVRKIEGLLAKDRSLARDIETLRRRIEDGES